MAKQKSPSEDCIRSESACIEEDSRALSHQIGQKLREFRSAVGMSQRQLADQLGVSFQQLQKYEAGANYIGAHRVVQIARILNVDVSEIFRGISTSVSSPLKERGSPLQTTKMMAAYANIRDLELRTAILQLALAAADKTKGPDPG